MTGDDYLSHLVDIHTRVEDIQFTSNCCGAEPIGEVDMMHHGRCSECKEHAIFEPVIPDGGDDD